MKAAHINAGNEYGGGLVHIVSLLSALQKSGVTTELILMEDGPVAKAARAKGLTVTIFEQSSRYDLRVLKRLQEYINANAFDVIHTHGPRANMLINLLKPFLKGKWVVTIHSNPLLDFENKGVKGKLFEKINTRSLIKADGVIAVSNEIKSIAIELGANACHISTIHNGIQFTDPLVTEKNKELFTLVSVGRLHAIKNFDLLLESLAVSGLPHWKLILCGDGEEEAGLRKKAEDLNVLSHIEFKGWIDSHELKQVISQTDVMVHPSKSESFPLVLLEAAEQEVPVIATNVGDVKELISDQSYGWLVESNNIEQMTAALKEAHLAWSEGRLKDKGKKLREQASAYSLSSQSEKVTAFYTQIL
ncbi:MAG: glycosyltransferase family 4 protein [Alkalibacterium sp.]|nr:glycosyltransferase family 4 protein [Alkalibacterium sp.]